MGKEKNMYLKYNFSILMLPKGTWGKKVVGLNPTKKVVGLNPTTPSKKNSAKLLKYHTFECWLCKIVCTIQGVPHLHENH